MTARTDREHQELLRLTDATAALDQARSIVRDGTPKSGDQRLLALAYCMLTFGEMLKQASHGTVTQAYSGPIALRDKLAHVPHRKLNVEVLAASVEQATAEILSACRKCHPPWWEVVRAVYRRSAGEVAKTGALTRLAVSAAR
ncbi:hypothetical protein SSOG_00446 [Streptomyces himastatinicus ATCC 53653]|uniref:Uncharacterized protein n=1 Tax=Streptomyces himastatinicus ATCC 53653 TaxID=457427 RepID=D9WAU0_9ACTN|nr:hypothetical protein [Streptomyces himastatinicus]EFL20734.1 hypothetical protein SSOG_00446 [Streptomyces himastatinicus ATCC 53653]